VGVLFYLDEGRDARYSSEIIRKAAAKAGQVIVLRPDTGDDNVMVQRRGQRKYRLVVEGKPRRLGQARRIPEVILWTFEKLTEVSRLSSRKGRIALSPTHVVTEAHPMLLPHRVTVDILFSYLDEKSAIEVETVLKKTFHHRSFRCELDTVSDRPPMKQRPANRQLADSFCELAKKWDIPLTRDSSVWPSVGGLVPDKVPVVCGIGPTSRDLYTPHEAVNRTSLIQRTLLVAQFLAKDLN
jgi:D-alanine-D-alanine ligase